jgi:hypothetical protein
MIEVIAMLAIGDHVLAIISPTRHISLWLGGPRWWDRICEAFVRRPTLTRVLGIAGLIAAVWLAWRQEAPVAAEPTQRGDSRWPRRLAQVMR